MTWPRLVGRNRLLGDYGNTETRAAGLIAGDMRRLEQDSRDDRYGVTLASAAGVTPEQARAVLDAFFTDAGIGNWPPDFVPRAPVLKVTKRDTAGEARWTCRSDTMGIGLRSL